MNTGNRPSPGEMFLDHTGHFIKDAESATNALHSLGFTVTPFSAQVQPDPDTGKLQLTGTGNICVMLPEGYLEFLVYTADTPIGREFNEALSRRAGLHLSAFAVADAAAHHAKMQAEGFPMRPLVNFSRDVETESGAETAKFTVARLVAGVMPEGRVQVMTHHNVGAMWQPRWLAHVNGAQSLRAIVVSAPEMDEAAERFGKFLGVMPISKGHGKSLPLARGAVDIIPEPEAEELAGQAVDTGRSSFVALRIGVSDLSAIEGRITGPVHWQQGALVAPFHQALGAGAWIFEQV